MKKIIKKLLFRKSILNILINFLILLHNFSYKYIGIFACFKEGVHPKHRLMKYHDFFLNNITNNDSVLDIGCGLGELAYDISKKAKKVTAIDFDCKKIEKAKNNFANNNLGYLCSDILSSDINETYDIAVLSNVLEHIKNRQAFLKKMASCCKRLLIRIPMINRDWLTYYKKELGTAYLLDKTHKIEYTLKSFSDEIDSVNLKIESYTIQFGELWAIVT